MTRTFNLIHSLTLWSIQFLYVYICYRYKYILAYLPLVAFYYRGKTLFKFNLESSFEELRDAITNITGYLYIEYLSLE